MVTYCVNKIVALIDTKCQQSPIKSKSWEVLKTVRAILRVLLQEWRQEKKKISGESLKTVFFTYQQSSL